MSRMGALFAFEGGDGVGKATQTKLLIKRLEERGKRTAHFSFPRYDTPVGQLIEGMLKGRITIAKRASDIHGAFEHEFDPLIFQSLMLVDKRDADRGIYNALVGGTYVVCDRWYASALAYGMADGVSRTWLESIHVGLEVPDITFLLQISEETALARRPELRDRYERDRSKQARVSELYKELATDEEKRAGHWVQIDGSGERDEVEAQIWKHVSMFLDEDRG